MVRVLQLVEEPEKSKSLNLPCLYGIFQYFTYTSKLILGACFPLIGGNSSSYDDDELEQLKKFLSNHSK